MPGIGVPPELIVRLRDDIAHRRIANGMRCLEESRAVLEALGPEQKNAGVLLGYLAQWVDIGFPALDLLRRVLARFPKDMRAALPLADYLHLRMAEGLVCMAEEEFEPAIRHFQFVESVEEEIRDPELLAISSFWVGRCLRRQGRYDDALSFTIRGRELAASLGHERMAAVMQITESWLAFQKGRLKEAAASLRSAEAALGGTDDYVSRGNIQSAYGRICRREGRYDRALQHFETAIEEYKRRDPQHRNLARSLVNIAFVERLIALQLQKRIDLEAERRKREKAAQTTRAPEEKERLEHLRAQAFAHLEEALAIFGPQDNHRGMGTVHVYCGFLCLDGGDLDRAGTEAEQAFRLGDQKHDLLQMARARVLQCMVEEARFEEQMDEPSDHARRANEFAREAVETARQTQNRRLLARALIWQGLTFSNEFFNNAEAARQCCDAASALLRPEGHDYIWEDLQALRARVLQTGRIDTVLREWSQGLVGGKTFQQITEEFAGIIIPRVWEREDRKIARVAATLSISPKKIRRILHAQGLLNTSRKSAAGR